MIRFRILIDELRCGVENRCDIVLVSGIGLNADYASEFKKAN